MTTTETFTGIHLDLINPTLDMICIEDIAHALSLQCRFNGHCSTFYSVAQHSVHVADFLKSRGYTEPTQLVGLLHDAQEAFVGDMITPLKQLPALGKAFAEIETKFEDLIQEKFNLKRPSEVNAAVKYADMAMLLVEARDLLPSRGEDWSGSAIICLDVAWPTMLNPWTSQQAENIFLAMFNRLTA